MKYTMAKNPGETFRTFADLKPGDLFILPTAIGEDKDVVFLKTKYPVSYPGLDLGGNAILLEDGRPAYVLENAAVKVYSKPFEFRFGDFNS